jgi:hypothetical protein
MIGCPLRVMSGRRSVERSCPLSAISGHRGCLASVGADADLYPRQQQNLHPRQLTLSVDELATANWCGTLRNIFSRGYGCGRDQNDDSGRCSRRIQGSGYSGFPADVRPKHDEQSQGKADQTAPPLTSPATRNHFPWRCGIALGRGSSL